MSRAEAKKSVNRSQQFSLQEKRSLREAIDKLAGAPDTDITDASEAHSLNAVFDNTEVEAALDALGVKINEILAVVNGD